jgi:hypothetical protein
MTDNPSRTTPRSVRHITIETERPYEAFRSDYERAVPPFDRLQAVGVIQSGGNWESIRALSEATAPHGCVNFFVFDPSPVMKVNGNNGRATTHLTGSIIMAERGFARDPSCFLYVPLRVVIAEGSDGNAQLSLDQPSDLFAVFGDPVLDAVGAEFGRAFAKLLAYLEVVVPPELANLEL